MNTTFPLHNIKPDMRRVIGDFQNGQPLGGKTTALTSQQCQELSANADKFIADLNQVDGSKQDLDPRKGIFSTESRQEISITDAGYYTTNREDGLVSQNSASSEQIFGAGSDSERMEFITAERTPDGGHRVCQMFGYGNEYSGQAYEISANGIGIMTDISPVRARGF